MAGHGIELDLQVFGIAAGVVGLQNAVGHGAGLCVLDGCGVKAFAASAALASPSAGTHSPRA